MVPSVLVSKNAWRVGRGCRGGAAHRVSGFGFRVSDFVFWQGVRTTIGEKYSRHAIYAAARALEPFSAAWELEPFSDGPASGEVEPFLERPASCRGSSQTPAMKRSISS